jgi:hypothetical protein
VSGGRGPWLLALGGALAVLAVPMSAHAAHPKPGSEVPWMLLLAAGVLVFAAAWGLTVFFERRHKPRAPAPGSREHPG